MAKISDRSRELERTIFALGDEAAQIYAVHYGEMLQKFRTFQDRLQAKEYEYSGHAPVFTHLPGKAQLIRMILGAAII